MAGGQLGRTGNEKQIVLLRVGKAGFGLSPTCDDKTQGARPALFRAMAQLVARMHGVHEVGSSSLPGPTKWLAYYGCLCYNQVEIQ